LYSLFDLVAVTAVLVVVVVELLVDDDVCDSDGSILKNFLQKMK
jgi:hypothetical protein